MEDPHHLPNDDPPTDDASELQRRAEEAMEEMLLAQEDEADTEVNDDHDGFLVDDLMHENGEGFDENGNENDDMGFLDDEDLINANNNNNNNGNIDFQDESFEKKNPFTYVRVSFWAAFALVFYAYRSQQQWYLALVFLSSSKYAYVVLGNAFLASLVWAFNFLTGFFLNGLRLNEAEGLGDYFRWHITETCLALTIFRSELNVKTFLLFLCLVFTKCMHHIVDARETHLRMTQEIVVANPSNGWISLRLPHVKLFSLICLLQLLDICGVVLGGQDIAKNGPSVTILFCFESAIMLTSVISNALLWHLHLIDGILHHLHETLDASHFAHKWIYPWKDHKATLVFAVELQAQFAKFIFYLTFFSIVFTYYGMPINLIREVYVSFLSLKNRLVAFNKYRKLMSSMNRFENPTQEELEKEQICIICREEMTVETAKRLPGCGHIFHKSCLREWLVQQQSCPTCRGDISEMEARQKQQDAFNARMQHNLQQGREQEQEEATGLEGGADKDEDDDGNDKDDATDQSQNESGEEKPNEEAKASAPQTPALPRIKTETNTGRKSPASLMGTTSTKPSILGLPTPIVTETFPAFYRVVRDTGASVYRHEEGNQSLSFLVTRTVPRGVVLLVTGKEHRICVLKKKAMVRMPDGWVEDNDVVRIAAVPLQELQ